MGFSVAGSAVGASPELTQTLGGIAAGALLLPFGRSQELEADHIGLVYMAKAGYDSRAARALWIRMGELSRGQSRPAFLSTHPSAEMRVKQIEGWLPEALQHYRPAPPLTSPSPGGIGPLPRDPRGVWSDLPGGIPGPFR
jgi:predicted Zn-dependent protease